LLDSFTPIWNALVVNQLEAVLRFLAQFTHSGGLAIILMTVIIKAILLPLSMKQTASMKKMQSIQPEVAALKKKYKDREKVTQETMKLYKERGINPASGCLPMLPTMVVLFGLYWALTNLAHTDPEFQEPFLWVSSLNQPDVFQLPIPGLEFPLPGILPIAMAITQFFSSKMMTMPSQDPQQAAMNRMTTILMPGMMLFWGVTFPAGLVLYWFVSNVFEMARLYFTMGPQSLSFGTSPASGTAGSSGGGLLGFLGLGGLMGPPASADDDTDEAVGEPTTRTTSGEGARANGRSSRPRQKRGKRSGRR
jgi:YidC/Oxa1 family membrane protein insertase